MSTEQKLNKRKRERKRNIILPLHNITGLATTKALPWGGHA